MIRNSKDSFDRKGRKVSSAILSLVIAFGLWLYVVNNVSQEAEATLYNVPVVMEGESVLQERGLMITSASNTTVSLTLSGARSDLNKVNSNNISVKVDLSKVYEPGEKISVNYTISFPGDVPNNAFVVQSQSPVFINVEYRRVKEVPVLVKYTGTRYEDFLYDTENDVLDYPTITVIGPASVADRIEYAEVEVDLTNREESISESFRYTLCDADGNPVDATEISTNVEAVRLETKIQRIKDLKLSVNLVYGGGASEVNTSVALSTESIRVTGSDTVLEELGDTYAIGTVNLNEIEKTTEELIFPITLPEGVTNQTGVSEVTVTIRISGSAKKTFTITHFEMINVPEGMKADIITVSLPVTVRGPAGEVAKITEDDIIAEVDFTDASAGTYTFKVTFRFGEDFPNVGALKTDSVSATVQAVED